MFHIDHKKAIVGVDCAWKKVGVYILSLVDNEHSGLFLQISDVDDDVEILKIFSRFAIKVFNDYSNPVFVVFDYTPVVRGYKATALMNRAIGVMMEKVPDVSGWVELPMTTIYSAFKVKGKDKKKQLHKLFFESDEFKLYREAKVYKYNDEESLEEYSFESDVIDAFFLAYYVKCYFLKNE